MVVVGINKQTWMELLGEARGIVLGRGVGWGGVAALLVAVHR